MCVYVHAWREVGRDGWMGGLREGRQGWREGACIFVKTFIHMYECMPVCKSETEYRNE